MTSHSNKKFPANLSTLNGKNYENWCKEMKVVFCFQDLWDLVKNGVTPIRENVADEQNVAHKDLKKKDYKVIFIIHQYVDSNNFEKFGDVDSVKEAWDILEKLFGGAEKVKEVRLETHKRTYELL